MLEKSGPFETFDTATYEPSGQIEEVQLQFSRSSPGNYYEEPSYQEDQQPSYEALDEDPFDQEFGEEPSDEAFDEGPPVQMEQVDDIYCERLSNYIPSAY